MSTNSLSVPDSVQGMTALNKAQFHKKVDVPVLLIDVMLLNSVVLICRQYLIKLDKFKSVRYESPKIRAIYLNPDKIQSFDSFKNGEQELLLNYKIKPEQLTYRTITLSYDNFSAKAIFDMIIPPPFSLTSFSVIGSIIHLNLKPELFPYKKVIGEVLLDKFKNCKSVVNKVSTVSNQYRNIDVEVLAGIEDLRTSIKENNCTFELDFRTVYWNPRLQEEHHEIISMIKDSVDVLYDVCCGIGPFAIPVSKKRCHVLANDLNPESCRYVERNKKINKIRANLIISNKDGYEFIRNDVKKDMLQRLQNGVYNRGKTHIIMNLPDSAYRFLSAFIGLFTEEEFHFPDDNLPVVHFYCFVHSESDMCAAAKKIVEKTIGCKLNVEDKACFVRNVAPSKDMMRVSFKLTKNILIHSLFSNYERINDNPKPKKQRIDDRMGKSKHSKSKSKTNIFKVSSSRSLKAKNKAKLFSTEYIKNTSVKNKQKIETIDQQLVSLGQELRQSVKEKSDKLNVSNTSSSSSKNEKLEKFKRTEENCELALNKLVSFSM